MENDIWSETNFYDIVDEFADKFSEADKNNKEWEDSDNMMYENEYFIIHYTESDISYIDDAIERINIKYLEYMEFFGVSKLPKKAEYTIYNDIEEFRRVIKTKYGHIDDHTVGLACGYLVEILTLNERRKVQSKIEITEETIVMTFAHELLHIFHAFYKGNNKSSWFAEGLAINLGSPRYELGLIDCTADDLINRRGKSRHFYAMVKYMLENMPHEKILEYAKNDDLVIKDTEEIYNLANEWIKSLNKGNNR